jgi:hypothetical protein
MTENTDLEQQNASAEMLRETIQQLEKDLGIAGFGFSQKEYNNLPSRAVEITAFYENLEQSNPPALMRAVNRVDLSENQFRKVKTMPGNFCENLAKATVLRAFQKVHMRKKFS